MAMRPFRLLMLGAALAGLVLAAACARDEGAEAGATTGTGLGASKTGDGSAAGRPPCPSGQRWDEQGLLCR
jgi:hypothetical protein